MDEKIYYKTSNINLASTLHTLNFPIDAYYQKEGSEVVEFYFAVSPELERTVDDFWNRRLKVEPNSLLVTRKELLDSIKNEKNFEKWSERPPDDNL